MTTKPAYEQIRQRVETVDRVENLRKQAQLNIKSHSPHSWLDNAPVCTKILDLDFNLLYMSAAGVKALKIDDISHYYGKPYPFDFYPESFCSGMENNLQRCLETNAVVTQEASVVDVEKNELWFHSTITPVTGADGGIECIIIISIETTARKHAELKLEQYDKYVELLVKRRTDELLRELTQRKQNEKKFIHIATHDELTGLPNRTLLKDRLEQALAWARRDHSKIAVLFVDLDNFKPINDGMGHIVGDEILRTMATRMAGCMRATDTIARFGGDEFVVVMTEIRSTEHVEMMADKLCQTLLKPVQLEYGEAVLGASIGIALYPDHSRRPEQLISLADGAMYQIKRSGRQGYGFSEQLYPC